MAWLGLDVVEPSRVRRVVEVRDLLVNGGALRHQEVVLSVRVLRPNVVVRIHRRTPSSRVLLEHHVVLLDVLVSVDGLSGSLRRR